MAGNKIHTKTKGKEDKNKTNKSLIQPNEENEDNVDFSVLRKPIVTSVTGFAQARKIFDIATEELKGIITNECDLLYECKVCRNIFRSLANFISHKRVYCKEQFSSSLHGQFFKVASSANEMLKIKKLEEKYFESVQERNGIEITDTDELDCRVPMTKDLTTIIEKIVANRGVQEESIDTDVVLQKIPNSSVAVFQSSKTDERLDKMRAQVKELDNILAQNKAILQSDGKFQIQSHLPSDSDNVIQISDDDESAARDTLKCKICDQKFSTNKTLKFHMKYKHLKSRLVYPCPDCLEIFSTSWSVYRHLFKVHRKTAAQIKRLRDSVQAKAFRMNNPPAFYERRKNMKPPPVQKLTEEERLDQENQAWMDNVEGEGDIPRCFGCGRTFERRAALAAHTHTCQPRRNLARRPPDGKRIEIQIRKDYNKGPPVAASKPTDATENKTSNEDVQSAQDVSKPSNEVDSTESNQKVVAKIPKQEEDEIPEKTSINVSDLDESESSPEKNIEKETQTILKPVIKIPFAQQTEKSNLTAFRLKMQSDIEISKRMCKRCDLQHETMQDLYDHMANHYKWLRYACKLCNFKHYEFVKLPEHVKIVHKLKGDNDFYYSTVKALDGNEALELSESLDEADVNDESSDSRRPSRCSSDSSRLSDDSSSSSTRVEQSSRKRKNCHSKHLAKRKKESSANDDDEDQKRRNFEKNFNTDNDSSSIPKTFEENSSDLDENEDKVMKRHSLDVSSSVASRRPVRKRTKRKNEDFEYDLSNLLKMEAQGYRDAQSVGSKSNLTKKKPTQSDSNLYEVMNRDCSGALSTLSSMAVEKAAAHIGNFVDYGSQKISKVSNIFVRPMLPKIISRSEKSSPKKDFVEDCIVSPNAAKEVVSNKNTSDGIVNTSEQEVETPSDTSVTSKIILPKNSNVNIPKVPVVKFRRQSLEVIKSPLINKNITDFKKAGMKTKILVIKPLNRNKDGTKPSNTPLKFQTIKIKDPSKSTSVTREVKSDQVVVVKVPKVDCTLTRIVSDGNTVSNDKILLPIKDSNKEKETLDLNVILNKNIDCENEDVATSEPTKEIHNKSESSAENDTNVLEEMPNTVGYPQENKEGCETR